MTGLPVLEKLISVAGAVAAPDGGKLHVVTTPDGVRLRTVIWPDPRERGTVIILNGRGDFIERYFETVSDLKALGFAAASFDFRGQGGSERGFSNPYRSSISHFSRFEEDLASFMTQVVLPECPPPYFLLGHSTGGLIGLSVIKRQGWFEKAVFTAPLLGFMPGAWPLPVARVLAEGVPMLGGGAAFLPGYSSKPLIFKGFEGNILTSDRKRFERDLKLLKAEPRLGLGGPSFSWLRAAFRHMGAVHGLKGEAPLKAPVLIVAAGQDRVVNTKAARAFAKRVNGVSYIEIKEAQHEILLERDEIRAQFLAAFDAFLTRV
jgi:lysophospholipase